MIEVDRSKEHCLVIGEHHLRPALRLLILLCLSGLYYYALFAVDGVLRAGETLHWTLALFPLFLSPYLAPIWRGLRGRNKFHFDAACQRVSRAGQPLVDFNDIDKVLLEATNASCEELHLALVLKSGRRVDVYEGPADIEYYSLARELAGLLDVELRHGPRAAGPSSHTVKS